ncbi:pentapeptide repeat-containing protein [Metabacillus sp. HB246100]
MFNLEDLDENSTSDKLEISDQEDDRLELSNVRLFKSKLFNLGLKHAVFSTCAITQSDIEKCYLRKAKFVNVDFTGSNFIDCDLENAQFNSCNLRYATFRGCKINLQEIYGCLPSEPNLKLALLKELRLNQLGLGENKSADEILIKIHDTEKELLIERVKCSTSYHREREDFISRTIALFNYLMLQLNDFIWGYGLKLSRLFRTALLTLLIFALLIYFFTEKEYITVTENGNKVIELNFWQSLYASYTNFTTVGYGHFTPNQLTSSLLFAVENLLGLIFIGFLVSGVYRRIAK